MAQRIWTLGIDPETGDVDAEQLAQLAVDVATVVRMVGGVATIGRHDREVEPEQFVTDGIVARWTSFAPAQRLEQPEGEPEPVEEPEPAAATG